MNLAFGLDFTELNKLEGLKKLDHIFLHFLQESNHFLHEQLVLFRNNADKIALKYYSDFLLEIAPILEDFLAQLFGIEQEVMKLRSSHQEFDVIYECKRRFVHRTALKKYPPEKLLECNINQSLQSLVKFLGQGFTEEQFARQILAWQLSEEKYLEQLNEAAIYAAFMVYNNSNSVLFSVPRKIDQDNLIDLQKIANYKTSLRVGFDFFAPEVNLKKALNGAHYCIYCHKQDKDSCSKGLLPTVLNGKSNIVKLGCPLKQKISEMNYLKAQGFNLAALAIIILDNPMVAATGHRICNDCANSCIYQKQEPVDIPLIESNILQETLLLPYGLEIYLLLTNWNPLNIYSPLPLPLTNYKILVAGLGPAGFSLSYYLLRDGHSVVAIDGLKINPLPIESHKPIKYWSDYKKNLSEKIPSGFGGIAEYGITPRWDKNNLTILYLMLQRHNHFRLFGGVHLGSNITIQQAFQLGFDHLAICTGASPPKLVQIPNFLAKGVRTASDILMTIQSGGAFLEGSITNLLIRMPIIVIGGGLTAVDVAVESLLYYKIQVEKFYRKYQSMIMQHGKEYTEATWTDEDKLIAAEFIAHAKLFENTQDKEAILKVLSSLGGATIYYRRKLQDSPAYKLNPEEIMYAMAMGIGFVQNMEPIAINVDEYQYTESIEFNNAGVKQTVPAKSVIIAAGTENHRDPLASEDNFFAEKITYFGDCNPLFAGSVVKAIASSKEGYKLIGHLLLKHNPNCSDNHVNFFAKLDDLLTSRIQEVNILSEEIIELVVHSPLASQNFQPGQFFRLQNYSQDISKTMEPLALTGAYVDPARGLINLIVWEKGQSSKLCRALLKNEQVVLMLAGKPAEIVQDSTVVLIGSHIGNAVLIPIAKTLRENNCKIIYVAGYKTLQDRFYQNIIESLADIVIWCCEEGVLSKNRVQDRSTKGNIIDGITDYFRPNPTNGFTTINRILVAAEPALMESIKNIKAKIFGKNIPLIVSLNSSMQCMMKGICGQCVQKVTTAAQYIFVCACQEQDAAIIDFQGLHNRLQQNSVQEKLLHLTSKKCDLS